MTGHRLYALSSRQSFHGSAMGNFLRPESLFLLFLRLICSVSWLFGKSSQSGQPLPNVVKEYCRKGFACLHIILRKTRSIGCNSDAGGNFHELLASVDVDAAEFCVVAYIEIQGGVHRNEESNVAIQCDFQTRKGQYVASIAEGNA